MDVPRLICAAIENIIISAEERGKASLIEQVEHPKLLLPAERRPRICRMRRCRASRHQQPRSSSTLRLLEEKGRSCPRPYVHLLLCCLTTLASLCPVGYCSKQTLPRPLLLLNHATLPRLAAPRASCRRKHPPLPPICARRIPGGRDRPAVTREESNVRSQSTA